MCVWFLLSIYFRRNDIIDIAWGLGFVLLAWLSFLFLDSGPISFFVNILITLWGFRLSWHVFQRNKNKNEDSRYALWRSEWKHFYTRSFFQIYMLQGVLLFLVSIPVLLINNVGGAPFTYSTSIGILIWIIGYHFETVGDAELTHFISDKNNRGKVMQSGLWSYTRHPNYFGEVTIWWGIFVIGLSVGISIGSIIGPLVITCLILFVSGIPMLESRYKGNKEYDAYKKRTSVFFPWIKS